MSWRDRMLMKMMSNRVVLKIMSIPIVMKIITVEMKAFIWVMSLFSRKKKEAQTDQSHPSDSGNSTPS
jgi:hypothetical protein